MGRKIYAEKCRRHYKFKKLILEILAIPASSRAVEMLFSQRNIRCSNKKTVCHQKTWKFWFKLLFKLSKLKFKLLEFFIFQKKYTSTQKYTIF